MNCPKRMANEVKNSLIHDEIYAVLAATKNKIAINWTCVMEKIGFLVSCELLFVCLPETR